MEHKRPTIKVRCKNCKKWCTKYVHHVKQANAKGTNLFCGKTCHKEYQQTGTFVKCATCNKDVWKTPSGKRRSKSGKMFCDKHCATIYNNHQKVGAKHPNYKGTSYRKLALQLYGPKCFLCDYSNEIVVQVHHKDHNRKNNDPKNLIVLCPTHHWEIHLGVIPTP